MVPFATAWFAQPSQNRANWYPVVIREINKLQDQLGVLVASKIEVQQQVDLEYISS